LTALCLSPHPLYYKKENQITAQHDTNYNGAEKLNFLKSLDISKHRFLKLDEQN